jgi:plastocyanin
MRRCGLLIVPIVIAAVIPMMNTGVAGASTPIVVNSSADPGDGICDLLECTVREAIDLANVAPGSDTIEFSIGSGPVTISPTDALPALTEPVVIDGTTQPGYQDSPIVTLDASQIAAGPNELDGISLEGGASTVRGLVIDGGFGCGVTLAEAGGDTIAGNYIGVDASGTTTGVNTNSIGVCAYPSAPGNQIGGIAPADRNVISGNTGNSGIYLSSDTNTVEGNYIGLDAGGVTPIPNLVGIRVTAANDNVIGGSSTAAANVVSGSRGSDVTIGQGSLRTVLEGNLIGTQADGTTAAPSPTNGSNGIRVVTSDITQILGNTIAHHLHGVGVWVEQDFGNGRHDLISGNQIFANRWGGIRLVTGGNDDQPAPVLTSARASAGGGTQVKGTLSADPSTAYGLEFFANAPAYSVDSNGYWTDDGEGQRPLGSASVTTDETGAATFSVTVSGATVPGESVTATATSPTNDTSAFSLPVASALPEGGDVTWNFDGTGQQTVTDTSGLGLYDSGPQGAGQTFVQGFDAAGTYPYADTLDPSITGSIKVPVEITSAAAVFAGERGALVTSRTIRWSAAPAPTGDLLCNSGGLARPLGRSGRGG